MATRNRLNNKPQISLEDIIKATATLTLDTAREPTRFHGEGGLFNNAAIERDIISAVPRPIAGVADLLPVYPSVNSNPLFGTLTGHERDATPLPVNPCDDAPSGLWNACILTAQFGRIPGQTNVEDIDKMILNAERGDTRDLRLLVDSLLGATSWTPSGLSESEMLNLIVQSEMVATAINMEDLFIGHVFQGDPANNTVGGGYKEFPGFDLQISTGIVDAITTDPCPVMDSIVGDWDFGDVCDVAGVDADLVLSPTTTVDITGDNLYRTLQRVEYGLHMRARRQRVGVVDHVIAVRPELWQWMSTCLPCQMETEHCDVDPSVGQTIFIDGARQAAEQLRLQNEMRIRINGRWYNVVEDDGIALLDNTTNPADLAVGQFASHLYFIPLSIRGGRTPVTYLEHVDYSKITRELSSSPLDFVMWSDDGRFNWVGEQVKWCFQLSGKTEPRLILRTPQLAAKILNIKYTEF